MVKHSFAGLRSKMPGLLGKVLVFLLKADFAGPDLAAGEVPASLGAPYVSVGELTVYDPDGDFEITSGALQRLSTGASASYAAHVQYNMRAGLTIYGKIKHVNNSYIGWFSNAPSLQCGTFVIEYVRNLKAILINLGLNLNDKDAFVILGNIGKAIYVLNNEIVWIDNYDDVDVLVAPAFTAGNLATGAFCDSIRVACLSDAQADDVFVSLPSGKFKSGDQVGNGYNVWGHRDLDVTDSIASPAAGNTFEHTADALITLTADTIPTPGNILIHFRVQDSTNFWRYRIFDTGSQILYEVVDNIATARGSGAVLSGGEDIAILCNNEQIDVYVDGTLDFSYASATNFKTETAGEVNSLGTGGVISGLTTRTLDGVKRFSSASGSAPTASLPSGKRRIIFTPTVLAGVNNFYTVRYIDDSNRLYFILGSYSAALSLYMPSGKLQQWTLSRPLQEGEPLVITDDGNHIVAEFGDDIITYSTDLYSNATQCRAGGSGDPVGTYRIDVDDLSTPGIATSVLPGPLSVGDTFTHEADCVLEWQLDALASAGDTDIQFRWQDTNNYWAIQISPSGGFALFEIVASVATLRASVGGALVGGERLVIVCDDETIIGYYDTTKAWEYASAANFKTETSGEITGIGTDGRISNLIAWPRDLSNAPNTPGAREAKRALDALAR